MNPRPPLLACLVMLILFAAPAVGQETPEELYQSALYKQQVEGDLEGAREILETLIEDFADHREVAANALVLLGRVHETLGSTQAERAYRRVLNEYPEQRGAADEARARLARLTQELAELRHKPSFRKVEIASKPQGGVLSPDGTKLAFVSDGIVWAVPLHGNVDPNIAGEPLRIATMPGIWDYFSQMAWSADGEWIAVNGGGAAENAAYVFPARGGVPRTMPLPPRRGHYQNNRLSLSPNGQKIAFSAVEPGRELESSWDTDRLYSMLTAGGEPQQMASFPSSLPAFSWDGEYIAFVGYQKSDPDGGLDGADLWVVPSSGGTPIKLTNGDGKLRGPVWSPDGKYIAVNREPLAGNPSDEIWVYPVSSDVSSVGEPTKIVLPGWSYHILAGWSAENELGVFIESEARQAIYTVTASGGRAVQVTPDGGGPYYPRWAPDGQRIYLRWFFGEDDTGRVRDLAAGHETTAYVPSAGGDAVGIPGQSHRELGLVIPGGGHHVSPDGRSVVVSAAQLPWDPQQGHDIWTIPLDGGRPARLTSDASPEAYPCWSPDGQWVAFTDRGPSDGEDLRTIYTVRVGGGEIRRITSNTDSVGGGAIAFSPDGARIAFFSDGAIKMIPIDGGQSEVLVADVRSGRHSQLAWSPDGSQVAHSADGKIWITPLDSGVPQELRTGLPHNARIGDFSWSSDGEKIAFAGEIGGEAEFWLISDFLPER